MLKYDQVTIIILLRIGNFHFRTENFY